MINLSVRSKYLATAAILLALLMPALGYYLLIASAKGSGETVKIVNLEKGQSLGKIALVLEQERIIPNARVFSLYARMRGDAEKLRAGAYRFTDAMPPAEILRMLVEGEVYVKRFAVPEGYSIYQVAELLESKGLFTAKAFLSSCFDRQLLDELGIAGKSAEGYLYPSTYDVPPNMGEAELLRMMVGQFRKVHGQKLAERARGLGMSELKLLTLASMIDKEAIVASERPLISSVFHNRLKKGMRLQSDPTAVYGKRAFAGAVTRQDILRTTPYNTYQIDALPPGPIGNPGSDALEAALAPAKTDYLYFVARQDGTHQFSRSLEDHNRAVRTYLK